jgi:hypothetical protein
MPPVRNLYFHMSTMKQHVPICHSTPHYHKLASNPLFQLKGCKRPDMTVLMKRELCDADLTGVPLFINHLFPDHVLPFQITQDLLDWLMNNNNQSLYDQRTKNGKPCGVWVHCPNLTQKTEKCHMANWLNLICMRLSQIDPLKPLVPRVCHG